MRARRLPDIGYRYFEDRHKYQKRTAETMSDRELKNMICRNNSNVMLECAGCETLDKCRFGQERLKRMEEREHG